MSTPAQSIMGITTGQLAIPPGLTQSVLVDAGTLAGCNSVYLEFFSGGTASVHGVAAGSTLTAAQMASLGTGFILPTGRGVAVDGPARFYLASLGATSIIQFILGRSQGF